MAKGFFPACFNEKCTRVLCPPAPPLVSTFSCFHQAPVSADSPGWIQRWSVSLERLVNDWVFDFLNYIDTNNLNYKNLLSSRGIWYFSVIKMISILWSSDIDIINSQHNCHLPVFVLLEVTGQWEWSWRIQLHLETRRALFSCKTSAFGRGRHHTRPQQTPRSPM